MKNWKCYGICLGLTLVMGLPHGNAMYDGVEEGPQVRVEKKTPGGATVTIIEGVDPETGRRFVEKTETTTTTVRAEVDPEVRTEYIEVPSFTLSLTEAFVGSRKFADAQIVEGADALTGDLSRFLCRESPESIERKTTVERRRLNR